MENLSSWKKNGLSVIYLGIMGLYGCPRTPSISVSNLAEAEALPVVQSIALDDGMAETSAQDIRYEVCGEIADWQRPSFSEQMAELAANPRYGHALDEDPLKGLSDKFWNETLVMFTTYGLSARTEPIYLSGVWTGIDAMNACYEGDRAEAINRGAFAEMWLLGHQIVDITWTGTEYQVIVSSSSEGLQFVQFERVEVAESLPIVVIDKGGTEHSVIFGDW